MENRLTTQWLKMKTRQTDKKVHKAQLRKLRTEQYKHLQKLGVISCALGATADPAPQAEPACGSC